ncbi:hypothetical protein [Roseibium sp. MMSF_3544]|uniref:hypothetical protein n=1 Tax=unclassified Roseibium TaxID=2629323 RepID=UPI00273F147A|nr:hypothetical protein [Roseibium sp. MMSF_3544]
MSLSNTAAPSVEYFLPKDKNDPNFRNNVFYLRLGAYDASHEPESSASDAPTGLYCYSPDHYTLKATGKLYETVAGPAQVIVEEGDYVYTNTDGDLTIDVGQGVLLKAEETVEIIADGPSADGKETFLIDAGDKNNIRFSQKGYDDTVRSYSKSITKGNKFKYIYKASLTGHLGISHNLNYSFDVKISTFSFSTKLSAAVDGKSFAFTLGHSAFTVITGRQLSVYIAAYERTFLEEEFLVGKNSSAKTSYEEIADRAAFVNYMCGHCEINIESAAVDVESHSLASI